MSSEKVTDSEKDARPWKLIAALLIIASTLCMIPSLSWIPLLPLIKKSITMSFTQYGLLTGIAGIIAIVFSVPSGMAVKKFGSRNVFIPANIIMITGLLIISFSTSFGGILSGRGIWQFGMRFLLVAVSTALIVTVPNKYRATVLGISASVGMIGNIIAQNIGAYISQEFGWNVSIRFFAASVFLGGVIFFLFFKKDITIQGGMPKADKSVNDPGGAKPRSILFKPSVWLLCLLVICAAEEGLVDSFAAVQMNEFWNTNEVEFAKYMSMGLFLAIFVNIGIGWCGDRYDRWNMLIMVGILNTMVGVCYLIGQHDHKVIYIMGIVIAKGFMVTSVMLLNSMAPTLFGVRNVGVIVAIFHLGTGISNFIGPQILGILRDKTQGYTIGWYYLIACGVIATLFTVGFKYYFKQKGETGPE